MRTTNRVWVSVLAVAGLGFGLYLGLSEAPASKDPTPETAKAAILKAEEREAYLKNEVTLEAQSGPVYAKGSKEVVGGLISVKASLLNLGKKPLDEVILVVSRVDESGQVLSEFQESILRGKRLEPGERREGEFMIPDGKGRLAYRLR